MEAVDRILVECDLVEINLDEERLIDRASLMEVSENHPDLFGYKAVQISAGLNKNDSYFPKEELWKAKFSSAHKKIDIEHDDKIVIGHLVNSVPVDADMNVLDHNDESNALKIQHIVTYGVLYKVWQDKATQAKVEEIIKEIPDGIWKVSMESLTMDYDFLLVPANTNLSIEECLACGIARVVAKNDSTMYLKDYLRRFGGPGVYKGDRIYLYSKDIIFIGQGLVKKPANAQSIILDYDKTVKLSSSKIGESVMAEVTENAGEVVLNVAATVDMSAEVTNLKAALDTANSTHEAAKAEWEKAAAELESAKTELNAAKVELAAWVDRFEKTEKEKSALKEKCDALLTEKAAWDKEKMDKCKAEKMVARANMLKASLGFNEDAAKEMCDMDMDDASFEKVVAAMSKFKLFEKKDDKASVSDQASQAMETLIDTAAKKQEVVITNASEPEKSADQKILEIFHGFWTK